MKNQVNPQKPTMGVIKNTGLQQKAKIDNKPAKPHDHIVKGSDLRSGPGKNGR